MKNKYFPLVAALLALAPAIAAAEDKSAWDEAFPAEESRFSLASQGAAGAGEAFVAAVSGPGFSNVLREIRMADAQNRLISDRFRASNLDEVAKAHPELKTVVERKKLLDEMGSARLYNGNGEIGAAERRLAEILSRDEQAAKVEALVAERANLRSKADAALKNYKGPSATERYAAKEFRAANLKYAASVAIAIPFVIDGGLRMTAAALGRDAGYSPAITAGHTLLKAAKAKPSESASAGAATGMSVE